MLPLLVLHGVSQWAIKVLYVIVNIGNLFLLIYNAIVLEIIKNHKHLSGKGIR